MLRRLLLVLALLLGAGLVDGPGDRPLSLPVAAAQDAEQSPAQPVALIEAWDASATRVDEAIARGDLDFADIDELRAGLQAERTEIRALIGRLTTQLAPFVAQRDALGAVPPEGQPEPPAVAEERQRLAPTIAELSGLISRAELADARAQALTDRLFTLRRNIFTERLVNRGPSILEPGVIAGALESYAAVARGISGETASLISRQGMDVAPIARLLAPFLVMGVSLYFLARARRAVLARLKRAVGPGTSPSRRLTIGVGVTALRLIAPSISLGIALFAFFISGYLGTQGRMVVVALAGTAAIMIGAHALSGAFFAPQIGGLRISSLGDHDALRAHRWLILLAAIVGIDLTLVVHGEELGISVEGLSLLNTVIVTLGAVALWRLMRILRSGEQGAGERGAPPADSAHTPDDPALAVPPDDDADEPGAQDRTDRGLTWVLLRVAGIVLCAVALLAPALALIGYFAASRFVFFPPVYSAALIGGFVLLHAVVREAVETFAGRRDGDRDGGRDEGATGERRLRLIPVTVGFLLSLIALPLLAMIWGAQGSDLLAFWDSFAAGFQVGDLTISPIQFVHFLIVFLVGYLITRVAQNVMRRSVLPLTDLDAGGRAAVNAGIGYTGVIAASLIAISTAGLDLSNIAIVAGALSVGIGFGLQNVVNNFVSGLILLIERPIKAGDWIEVPSGMGYVKQINVRSTEIETFDHSALIVPNSELVANTVTNYTHGSLRGRMIAKVSVALGTDTRKVESLLLEIARAHPMVLRRPAPWINFAGFDAGTMLFEIRAILRDVNWVINVRSDMNHEIARRFMEEGIEIPYPQRDLHVRSAAAFRDASGAASAIPPALAEPAALLRAGPGRVPDGDPDPDGAGGDGGAR